MGPVIDQLPDLWEQLRTNPLPNPYVAIQEKLFHETFSMTAEPAGLRAAEAIHHYLTKGKK